MSAFHSVVGEFDTMIKEYGFALPKKLWYENIVVMSKRLEDVFFCYVIARVYKEDGSLQTDCWVGPVNRPDDGLDMLSANIKIEIGKIQKPEESFFRNCEKKIMHLLQQPDTLADMISASKKELESPSFTNVRYEVYTKYELPLFRLILKEAGDDKKILKNKKEVEAIVDRLWKKMPKEMKSFFSKIGLKGTKQAMWEYCYLYSL